MNAQIQFGQWLKSIRTKQGLSLTEAAKQLGYHNIGKGCRRISSWESGEQYPNTSQRKNIKRGYSISAEEWDDQLNQMAEEEERNRELRSANLTVECHIQYLLVTQYKGLLDRVDTILSNPLWRDIPLRGLHAGMAYIGGVQISLGGLLTAWSTGLFQGKHPDGGLFYALKGGGSPLSGMQQFIGFVAGSETICTHRRLYRPLASHLGPVLQVFKRETPGYTPWTLTRLMTHWGFPQPLVRLKVDGEPWASYCHDNQTLRLVSTGQTVRFDDAIESGPNGGFQAQWFDNSAVIKPNANLAKQLGSWRGRTQAISVSEGVQWEMSSGGLSDQWQNAVLTTDGELPAMTLAWIARRLGKARLRG